MNIAPLLEIIAEATPDRIALTCGEVNLTYRQLLERATAAATVFREAGVQTVGYMDVNSPAFPVAMFGAALADLPLAPINYRLHDEQVRSLAARLAPSLIVSGSEGKVRLSDLEGVVTIDATELLEAERIETSTSRDPEAEDVAVLLFTSGTTGEPKAAVLRHRHLSSYILASVEPFSADEDEAALVSVPPYHVAGVAGALSAIYAGRRIVYLPQFDPERWIETARLESISHAMVVPTMLRRLLALLPEEASTKLPSLRHISYGGGRMPLPVIESAMRKLPTVDFVNAYGLTETSSTIAVLAPEDHRSAHASTEPTIRERLTSVGKPLPHLEVSIRDALGEPLGAGERGEIWVRGDQVAGEYRGHGNQLVDGWFPTRDAGRLDHDGYLYLDGRIDEVIVRGGENISPGEVEAVIQSHPGVREVAVFGVSDLEWGEVVCAAVVADPHYVSVREIQDLVRSHLRSSRVPELVFFKDELPHNEMGKLLRRELRSEFAPVSEEAARG